MVQVLEDEHLESLQCSWCHKYLSVFPVKNHLNRKGGREVTCGRCSQIKDHPESSVQSTLYELVAKKYLFRCINRYEGCRKLLRAKETKAHESKCVGNKFDCPKCNDGNGMSVLELIWHYKQRHFSSCLKKNSFEGKARKEDFMLYIQDDVVFFIFMRYQSNSLHLSAMTLTNVKATQVFLIKRGQVWEKTEKTPCKVVSVFNSDHQVLNLDSIESIELIFNLEVLKSEKLYISMPGTSKSFTTESDQIESKEESIKSDSNENSFKIKLTKRLEHNLGYKLTDCGKALLDKTGHRIDLTCTNCKQIIGLPIFTCEKLKHNICYNCQAWCGICDCSVQLSDSDDLLQKVSSHLSFPCRWKCGEYFNSDLRTHEMYCKLKLLKCPMCSIEMNLSDSTFMDIHLLDKHQMLNFIGTYDYQRVIQFINHKLSGELSFLFHDKCCYLKWSNSSVCDGYYSRLYNLNFGLFENESNLKLDVIYLAQPARYSANVIQTTSHNLQFYAPYINFNTNQLFPWSKFKLSLHTFIMVIIKSFVKIVLDGL